LRGAYIKREQDEAQKRKNPLSKLRWEKNSRMGEKGRTRSKKPESE